jgi:hypothetical protein
VAEGRVATDAHSLVTAVRECLVPTGTAVLKRNCDAGGYGNIALTTIARRALPGTVDTILISDDLESVTLGLWEKMSNASSREVIVEAYYDAEHILYYELAILETGRVEFLNSGTLRMAAGPLPEHANGLLWSGFVLPAILPPHTAAKVATEVTRVAEIAGEIGYRGNLSVDVIVTVDDEVVVNEINARLGGCSHIHVLAKRLLGKQYGDRYVLCARNDVKAPAFEELQQLLARHGLAFDRAQGRGVLILAHDDIYTQTIQYLVIDRAKEAALEIERRLLDALSMVGEAAIGLHAPDAIVPNTGKYHMNAQPRQRE